MSFWLTIPLKFCDLLIGPGGDCSSGNLKGLHSLRENWISSEGVGRFDKWEHTIYFNEFGLPGNDGKSRPMLKFLSSFMLWGTDAAISVHSKLILIAYFENIFANLRWSIYRLFKSFSWTNDFDYNRRVFFQNTISPKEWYRENR